MLSFLCDLDATGGVGPLEHLSAIWGMLFGDVINVETDSSCRFLSSPYFASVLVQS